eukprot:TRINITY_DN74077_c0_g1_i1.p1 TRINITY_DN74077_c0_g1~~TRINITY_DN74077_c0_g1_i1.p1  ORF type:complete len:713 (+),score=96.65 TRINITY_DN74077_c0_g1_i1:109-2247(+)
MKGRARSRHGDRRRSRSRRKRRRKIHGRSPAAEDTYALGDLAEAKSANRAFVDRKDSGMEARRKTPEASPDFRRSRRAECGSRARKSQRRRRDGARPENTPESCSQSVSLENRLQKLLSSRPLISLERSLTRSRSPSSDAEHRPWHVRPSSSFAGCSPSTPGPSIDVACVVSAPAAVNVPSPGNPQTLSEAPRMTTSSALASEKQRTRTAKPPAEGCGQFFPGVSSGQQPLPPSSSPSLVQRKVVPRPSQAPTLSSDDEDTYAPWIPPALPPKAASPWIPPALPPKAASPWIPPALLPKAAPDGNLLSMQRKIVKQGVPSDLRSVRAKASAQPLPPPTPLPLSVSAPTQPMLESKTCVMPMLRPAPNAQHLEGAAPLTSEKQNSLDSLLEALLAAKLLAPTSKAPPVEPASNGQVPSGGKSGLDETDAGDQKQGVVPVVVSSQEDGIPVQRGPQDSARPDKLCGDSWEEPKETLGLRLVGDVAPRSSNWTYVLVDESRRSFAGYLPNCFSPEQCSSYFQQIRDETSWKQPESRYGGQLQRKTAWMVRKGCSCTYRYGGIEVEHQEFPPWMSQLLQLTMHQCGKDDPATWPDSCNLNLYEDGGKSVGWHADDEALFQGKFRDVTIISLSLGVTRTFELRPNWPEEGEIHLRDMKLGNGDLMTMEGMLQKHYQHRVPWEDNIEGPRINLTWRWVLKHAPHCAAGRSRDAMNRQS